MIHSQMLISAYTFIIMSESDRHSHFCWSFIPILVRFNCHFACWEILWHFKTSSPHFARGVNSGKRVKHRCGKKNMKQQLSDFPFSTESTNESGVFSKCFHKWGYPWIIHFNGIFYKLSILGYCYPHLWKPPCLPMLSHLLDIEFKVSTFPDAPWCWNIYTYIYHHLPKKYAQFSLVDIPAPWSIWVYYLPSFPHFFRKRCWHGR